MKKKIAMILTCTMIFSTVFTGCGGTAEEVNKATENTNIEKNNGLSIEPSESTSQESITESVATESITTESTAEVETTVSTVETETYEGNYMDINIRTHLPEEINQFVPEHLDQWHEYIRKMLATYDAVNRIKSSPLGVACLQNMSGLDGYKITDYADKDLTGKDFNINDFGAGVVQKYVDLYVNEGKRDVDFDKLFIDTTPDEAENILNSYLGLINGICNVYCGIPELNGDLPFDPEFNMNADFTNFENPEYKDWNGREWDYTDADDNFLLGTHYLYSFYNYEEPSVNGNDLGLCWFFDSNDKLINIMLINMVNE